MDTEDLVVVMVVFIGFYRFYLKVWYRQIFSDLNCVSELTVRGEEDRGQIGVEIGESELEITFDLTCRNTEVPLTYTQKVGVHRYFRLHMLYDVRVFSSSWRLGLCNLLVVHK